MVEHEEREDGVEQVVNAEAVGPNDEIIAAFTGEVGVAEDDFVVMPHPVKGGEQFGTKEWRDAS